jgi:hypothetical protein
MEHAQQASQTEKAIYQNGGGLPCRSYDDRRPGRIFCRRGWLCSSLAASRIRRAIHGGCATQFAQVAVAGAWMDDGIALPAYSDGVRWNGWLMPYFTREVAMRLIPLVHSLRYDETRDVFVALDPNEGDEIAYGAEEIRVGNDDVVTYSIGAGEWCWQEADPKPHEAPVHDA